MYRYEFTYSYINPEVHVFKIVIDAFNDADAYYDALFEIAKHILSFATSDYKAPCKAELICVEKGKI